MYILVQEQRYYASVPENVTVGTGVITVKALDPDQGRFIDR